MRTPGRPGRQGPFLTRWRPSQCPPCRAARGAGTRTGAAAAQSACWQPSRRRFLLAGVGVDAVRVDEDRRAALLAHYPVVGAEVLVGTSRRGEDLAQQQAQAVRVEAGDRVIGADEVDAALGRRPLPARPDDHVGVRAGAPVSQLPRATAHDHADDALPGYRVRQHARVHYRRRDRPVAAGHGDHDKPVIPRDQLPEILDVRHVTYSTAPARVQRGGSADSGSFRRGCGLRTILAAVLLAWFAALVVDEAGAAEGLGHRVVRRGRLGIAPVRALGSAAPAVTGVARAL